MSRVFPILATNLGTVRTGAPASGWFLWLPALLLLLGACVERSPVLFHGEVLPGDAASADAVDVVGTDFAFDVQHDRFEAGRIEFLFANRGQEPHEMAIVSVEDGRYGIPLTEIEFISPGESATLRTNLPAGSYAFVCLVITEDHHRPQSHVELGMFREFEVQ